MAREVNKLNAARIATLTKPGRYNDGDGLYLQVSRWGTKAWLYRFEFEGKARQMGLGDVRTFTLAEARQRSKDARKLLADGIDPINHRKGDAGKRVTFWEAAERYIKSKRDEWKNVKHAGQWTATLETYAKPTIGELNVAEIETSHIINILEPIWKKKTETASRLRGRIESVLDWATAREFRQGDNPARWKGHLDKLLARPTKVAKVEHHAALPYAAVGAFLGRVRGKDGVSARALEWTVLTACRTGEAIGARWQEIDLARKIWTIPADRMKAGKEHRVPLAPRAIAILNELPREEGNDFVFVGGKKGAGLSNMAMLQMVRGMDGCAELTVHGFRSAFRDWAAEQTNFPRELAEKALAHTLKDETEAAYQRGDLLEKRRRMMEAWAKFCEAKPVVANVVVPIRSAS